MLSLYKTDVPVLVYITDGQDMDYYTVNLDNRDMFRLVGRAMALGYRDFEIGLSQIHANYPEDVELVTMYKGVLTVNWDIIAVLPKEAWGER